MGCVFLHVFQFMPISSPDSVFDRLLKPSHRYNSSKWSDVGFGEEVTQVMSLKLILSIVSGALSYVYYQLIFVNLSSVFLYEMFYGGLMVD